MSRTQERQQGPQRRQRALPGALAQTVDATALEVLASPRATPLLIAHTLANRFRPSRLMEFWGASELHWL